MGDISRLPRVASIATMPSRIDGFRHVVRQIHPQVDHLFVYLDGYGEPPDFLAGLEHTTVHRAEDTGDLHASSRLLCLGELTSPSVVAVVDDDIAYPADYLDRMAAALDELGGEALIGLHGRIFTPPHRSYVRDAQTIFFTDPLKRPWHVHELGVGVCAFVSDRLMVDPRQWDRTDMDDLMLAEEAKRRGLPLIAIRRPPRWLGILGRDQPDSLWRRAHEDDSEHSRRMRALIGLYLVD